MDFIANHLGNSRCFRVLNVIDDCSRELVGQLVDFSISGKRDSRFLNDLIEVRGKPNSIVCDNGPEFTSKAMFFWSKESEVTLKFIQPGMKLISGAITTTMSGRIVRSII